MILHSWAGRFTRLDISALLLPILANGRQLKFEEKEVGKGEESRTRPWQEVNINLLFKYLPVLNMSIPVTLAPDHMTLCFLTYITCRILISNPGRGFRSQTFWSDTVTEPVTNRQTPNDAVIMAEMRPSLNFIFLPLKVK